MPLTREEEKKLVIQSQKGDAEAMGILYESFQLELLRSALLILKNEDIAQDIVSETFILFFKSIDKFDVKYPIRPWLHRILHNQSTTFFQKRTRTSEFQQKFETVEPNAEEHVFRNEEKKYLQKAMMELDDSDRWILEGYYYQDLSIRELAVELSIPEGTVKSRLFKARGMLAEKINALFENRSHKNDDE
jgi:RNA polymerase sigma-70 factor (ECF subfamily)